MSQISDYWENAVQDYTFRRVAMPVHTALFVELYTATPSDSGGGTAVTGGSYARAQVLATTAPGDWATATDLITETAHSYRDGTGPVRVRNEGGALPTGISGSTDYYIRVSDANTIFLALTPSGAAVDFTTQGTGTHFIEHMLPCTATGGLCENRGTIDFPDATANWGTVSHFGIFDAKTAGNLLWWGALTASLAVNSGQGAQFAVQQLDFTLA
jgi:hypothetical protein